MADSMEMFTTRSSIQEVVGGSKASFSIYNLSCKKEIYHPGDQIEGALLLQPAEIFDCSQIEIQIICTASCVNVSYVGSEGVTPRFHPRSKLHYSSESVVFYDYRTAGVNVIADDVDIPFSIGPIPYHAGPSTIAITEDFEENGYKQTLSAGVKYALLVTFRGAKNEIIFQSSAQIPVFNQYSLSTMMKPIEIKTSREVRSNSVFWQASKPIGSINMEARSNRTMYGPGDKVVVSYRGAVEHVKMARIKTAYVTLVRCVQVCADMTEAKTVFQMSEAQGMIERSFEQVIWRQELKVTSETFDGQALFLVPADLAPSYETKVDHNGSECLLWYYVIRCVVTAAGNNVYSDTTAEVNIPITINGRALDGFERLSVAEQNELTNQPVSVGHNSRGEIPADRFGEVAAAKGEPLKLYIPTRTKAEHYA